MFIIPKRILISRTDNIGDVVLTLPLLGYLKSIAKDTTIGFIAKNYVKDVLKNCLFVNEIISKEDLLKDPKQLKEFNAEVILFIFPDKEIAKIAKIAKIPLRIGTSHRFFHWLYLNKRINFTRKKSSLHEAQLNFKLLEGLNIKKKPNLQELSQYYGFKVDNPSLKLQDLIIPNKFNLIIHPKSKGSAREWNLKYYFTLVKKLHPSRFHVFITGTKIEEQAVLHDLPELVNLPQVTNLMGFFSLTELMQFISISDGLIACSTGPLHLSAALGKLTIGIFPPMKPIDPSRWKAIGKQAHYLCINKVCSLCKKTSNCLCINEILPNDVFNFIEKYFPN